MTFLWQLVMKATLDLCWERQLFDTFQQWALEASANCYPTTLFQGGLQNSGVFCWHVTFAFCTSFHQQASSIWPIILVDERQRVRLGIADEHLRVSDENTAKNRSTPRFKNCAHEPWVICENLSASVWIHFIENSLHVRKTAELDCTFQHLWEPARVYLVTIALTVLTYHQTDLPEEFGRAIQFTAYEVEVAEELCQFFIPIFISCPKKADYHFKIAASARNGQHIFSQPVDHPIRMIIFSSPLPFEEESFHDVRVTILCSNSDGELAYVMAERWLRETFKLFDRQTTFHRLQVTTRRSSDECATQPAAKTSKDGIPGKNALTVHTVVASTERRLPHCQSFLSTVGSVARQSKIAGHKLQSFGTSKLCSGHQPKHCHRQLAKKREDVARVIHVMVALVHHNLENLPRVVEALHAKHMLKLTGEVIKIGEVKCSKLVGNSLLELLVRLVVALRLGSHHDKKR